MTLLVVDVSRHQVERADPLDLVKAMAAGMNVVNIQLDRGRQADVLPPWAHGYAVGARVSGMQVSTYRWLDNRISGAESARRAYDRMVSLGGPAGMAHVVDCEDNANEQTLRDYVTTMTALLGRPIAIYSGSWWLDPRGWRVNDLSPYLWAAPSAGYLDDYPGDDSRHWAVNYGGYTTLAAMQYTVQPLPGTGKCSLSAIRDPAVWTALTGGVMPTEAQLKAERWYNEEITTPELRTLGSRLCSALGVAADAFGAKGNTVHLNGGHRSQAWIENSRWCTNRTYATEAGLSAEEKRWISAFDITPKTREQMLRISQNIDRVTRAGQLEELVEWFGNTNDDTRVDGWDNIRNAVASSDSSHLWHLHGRLRRKVMRDAAVMDRVFNAVINGTAATSEVEKEDDMQPVLVKLAGEETVRLVTMGMGHIPMADPADLKRQQSFMSANGMDTTVWPWAADWRPQCGPDLTAVPSLAVTPEVAAAIAKQIVDAGTNDLSDADLEEIKALVVAGSKQAAREGTE